MMRFFAFCGGIVVLFGASAGAQVAAQSPLLLASSSPVTASSSLPASAASGFLGALNAAAPAAQADSAQAPYQAYESYDWEISGGYTFIRLYLLPKVPPQFPNGLTVNSNGLNISGAYYFSSIHWLGVEGDVVGTFCSAQCQQFALGGGGVRARWQASQRLILWTHGTLGGAHVSPQTSLGNQTSVAYQIGGGVDFFTHFNLGFRAEADLVGTHFFSTYQRSPGLSTAIVYRF